MAKAQIIKLRPLHEQIALSIVANPGITNRELAMKFGRTEVWISIVRNSDCFLAKIDELHEAAEDAVIADIPTKLRAVADLALDRVQENLQHGGCTPSYALNALKEALGAIGYTPGKHNGAVAAVGTQNNYFFTASQKELSVARARLIENHKEADEPKLLSEAQLVPASG